MKVDVDIAKDAAQAYDIHSMPTFVFVKSGQKVDRFSGARSDTLEEKILSLK